MTEHPHQGGESHRQPGPDFQQPKQNDNGRGNYAGDAPEHNEHGCADPVAKTSGNRGANHETAGAERE